MSHPNSRHPGQHLLSSGKSQAGKSLGCLPIFGLLILTIAVTIGATVWVIQSQLFTRSFKPVELSNSEQQTLEEKLDALTSETSASSASLSAVDADTQAEQDTLTFEDTDTQSEELQPEVYVEDDSKRRIELTERELNALLAKNTDLGEQLVVALTDNAASLKLLINVDPDFPFIGGKTLKVSGGTELSYRNDRPVIIMKGVSVWGVPVPNAWLGDLKNIDLVQEFGSSDGFWKSVADGIEDIRIENGKLKIQLAE